MNPFVQPHEEASKQPETNAKPVRGGGATDIDVRIPVEHDEVDDLGALHLTRVKVARGRLALCWMVFATATALSVTTALAFATAVGTAAPPRMAVESWMGWTATYATDSPGVLFQGPTGALMATAVVAAAAFSGASLWWRAQRIVFRHRDVGLFSWRDGVTWTVRATRVCFGIVAAVAFSQLVGPAENPETINQALWFHACELAPAYAMAAAGSVQTGVSGNIPLSEECKATFIMSMTLEAATEDQFRGAIPDHGIPTDRSSLPKPSDRMFWMRPVGPRTACLDQVATAGLNDPGAERAHQPPFEQRPLRRCAGTSPLASYVFSNWATVVRDTTPQLGGDQSAQCDPLAHATYYADTAAALWDAEQWFCGLEAEDGGQSVSVNYSTAGLSQVLAAPCYDGQRGDPSFMQSLGAFRYGAEGAASAGSNTLQLPRVRALVASLSDQQLQVTVGSQGVALARTCEAVTVSCVESTKQPPTAPARPDNAVVRSVALEGCRKVLVRSETYSTDKQRWDASLDAVKAAAIACLVASTVEAVLDILEACFSPCLY